MAGYRAGDHRAPRRRDRPCVPHLDRSSPRGATIATERERPKSPAVRQDGLRPSCPDRRLLLCGLTNIETLHVAALWTAYHGGDPVADQPPHEYGDHVAR